MRIQDLMIETTRNCNMKCRHCMRGNAQRKKMSKEVIQAFFNDVSYIGTVTFGGGEPTLALDVITEFYHQAVWSDCEIGNFYIVTNGKAFSEKLCSIVSKLYNLCADNELSGLAVSDDKYHDVWRTRELSDVLWRYEETLLYKYGLPESVFRPKDKVFAFDGGIKARGRAKKWGDRQEEYLDCIRFNDTVCKDTIVGPMYVAYNGNVVGDANMPYEDIDNPNYIRGNVTDWETLKLNLVKNGEDNYKWCQKHCNSFDGCAEWDDYNASLGLICDNKENIL